MPMGKGRLPAAACALLLLALTGAGIPGLPSARAAEPESRYLALAAEDGASSTPFGELPDMKKMTEALEIIGDTPLDDLSNAQLQALQDAGVDLDTLKENEDLLYEVRDTLPEEGAFPWPAVAGAAAAGAAGCVAVAVWFHHRKHPK